MSVSNNSLTARLSGWFYPSEEQRDPAVAFIKRVEQLATANTSVLDIGAGTGSLNVYDLKGRVKEIVGVDFDSRVAENPLLDRGVQIDGCSLPFEDSSFDMLFSIYVWEHVSKPAEFLRECFRVLRPGGVMLALTPNRYHYVPMIAAVTPHSFHELINSRRGRDKEDTFPTVYALNDRATVRRRLLEVGFLAPSFKMVECRPNYLAFSLPTFLFGIFYERLVNRFSVFSDLRVNLVCEVHKPPVSG